MRRLPQTQARVASVFAQARLSELGGSCRRHQLVQRVSERQGVEVDAVENRRELRRLIDGNHLVDDESARNGHAIRHHGHLLQGLSNAATGLRGGARDAHERAMRSRPEAKCVGKLCAPHGSIFARERTKDVGGPQCTMDAGSRVPR